MNQLPVANPRFIRHEIGILAVGVLGPVPQFYLPDLHAAAELFVLGKIQAHQLKKKGQIFGFNKTICKKN